MPVQEATAVAKKEPVSVATQPASSSLAAGTAKKRTIEMIDLTGLPEEAPLPRKKARDHVPEEVVLIEEVPGAKTPVCKGDVCSGGSGFEELAKKKAMLDLLQSQLATRQALRNASQEDISALMSDESAHMLGMKRTADGSGWEL